MAGNMVLLNTAGGNRAVKGGHQTGANGGLFTIDTSEVMAIYNYLATELSPAKARLLLTRVISSTGRRVKTIIGKNVPKEYAVGRNWVTQNIGKPFKSGTMCRIPIKSYRGIHGGRFKVNKLQSRSLGRVRSKMLNAGFSTLPEKMDRQGGNPPFIVSGSGTNSGLVFTRRTNKPLPIVRVAGLSVPEMSLARVADENLDDIVNYMRDELYRQFNVIINSSP